jgi:hypothetical protein
MWLCRFAAGIGNVFGAMTPIRDSNNAATILFRMRAINLARVQLSVCDWHHTDPKYTLAQG